MRYLPENTNNKSSSFPAIFWLSLSCSPCAGIKGIKYIYQATPFGFLNTYLINQLQRVTQKLCFIFFIKNFYLNKKRNLRNMFLMCGNKQVLKHVIG